jgi:hypothetical protein
MTNPAQNGAAPSGQPGTPPAPGQLSGVSPELLTTLEALYARAYTQIITLPDGRQQLIVPEGYRTSVVEPLEPRLKSYIEQAVTFLTRESFVTYVKDYRTPVTRIFMGSTGFTAIFDYHRPMMKAPAQQGENGEDLFFPPAPDRAAHAAHYTVPLSQEWKDWSSVDRKEIPQLEFAEFIEDHILDIRKPDGATLLEVARQLQIHRTVEFLSGKNLANGTAELTYAESDKASAGKGKIDVPTDIELALSIFKGEPRDPVLATFRYRLKSEGKLFFAIKIKDRERVHEAALDHLRNEIAKELETPVLYANIKNVTLA